MYLIYGTPDCKYCKYSKDLLDSNKIPYIYVDLTNEYGDDWRIIFSNFKSLNQTTIPFIFKTTAGVHFLEDATTLTLQKPELENLKEWKFVGTYFHLIDDVEEIEPDLSDNY